MIINNDVQVLIVDDDKDVVEAYQDLLEISGYKAQATTDPTQVLAMITKNWSGVIVSDMYMPGLDGMELLAKIKDFDNELPVILITGHGDIPMAVDAVKKGAVDFLQKPLQPTELLTLLEVLLPKRKQVIDQRQSLNNTVSEVLIGDSPLTVKLREQIANIALTNKDVLIDGESGTGRRTVSKLLHHSCQLSVGPYVEIDGNEITCTPDLQRTMISVRSGSLCLTNPHKMPMEVQQWLCRFLLEQDRQGKKEVRVLAIIDGDAEKIVESEEMLPELFYFLSQIRFAVPTLRQRTSDITPIFKHYLRCSCKKLNKAVPAVDKAYINTLNRHQWSGNIHELKSVAELYAIGIVKLTGQERSKPLEQMSSPLDELVDSYEKQVIEDALYLFTGRINEVSSYLQIPRKKLYLRMKKHGLDKAEFKVRPTTEF
ncbi:two-component system response regulator [Photobacterium frigidiphilum]|uniref:Two-component system response regulator n=1 Tax=Photobacterium frigidiphilum TaxID=264736 RepID=A0A2T3JP64_9GAMM|nr:sigma-54 dependent transcriptional regulator [Photobacterium frigidiphilum]PSU50851.1 two-component system response regulator [Photobacterium frigidiphilum]